MSKRSGSDISSPSKKAKTEPAIDDTKVLKRRKDITPSMVQEAMNRIPDEVSSGINAAVDFAVNGRMIFGNEHLETPIVMHFTGETKDEDVSFLWEPTTEDIGKKVLKTLWVTLNDAELYSFPDSFTWKSQGDVGYPELHTKLCDKIAFAEDYGNCSSVFVDFFGGFPHGVWELMKPNDGLNYGESCVQDIKPTRFKKLSPFLAHYSFTFFC